MYEYKNKKYDFLFTIFDDTDESTLDNIKPIYDLLHELKIITTKSVWTSPIKKSNTFTGQTLSDSEYLDFVLDLKSKGFEIAMHNVSSGHFMRKEILSGMENYYKKIGEHPNIHVNHATNNDNIYWGSKRFKFPFNKIYKIFGTTENFTGSEENSPLFWGDYHKKYIKYTRNHTFTDLNTIKNDPYMPYIEKEKIEFSNYWFSSTDVSNVKKFNKTLTIENIDKLKNENGISILYVHFASQFVVDGVLDKEFENSLRYLSKQNGLFLNVSDTLDYILERRINKQREKPLNIFQKFQLDYRFFRDRLLKSK